MPKRKFYIATEEEIKRGETTDVYFLRTKKILERKGLTKAVVHAEITASKLPENNPWAVLGGVEEVANLLEGLPIDVDCLPEGSIFFDRDYNNIPIPVMTITGAYSEFAVYETPLLGLLAQPTGISTKAARLRKLVGDKLMISFGARRVHPVLGPVVAKYAFQGGCDGESCVLGAQLIGEKPMGTMPHALIILFAYRNHLGGQREAFKAFDEVVEENVPRITLCDTYLDEVEEAIIAAETLGKKLWGVRFDTPGSRKGNFAEIIREAKWKLKQLGYDHVKIFVSGGINEDNIRDLVEAGADGFGVGSAISASPICDFALDITAVKEGNNWISSAKRGKFSGLKMVWKCENCLTMIVKERDAKGGSCPHCGAGLVKALHPLIRNGKIVNSTPTPQEIRDFVLRQLEKIELDKRPWD